MSPIAWLLMLILSVLWGGSFLFNRIAVAAIPPLDLVAARLILAALALAVLARLQGVALPRGRVAWRDHLVQGVLNNVLPFSLIVWGQQTIGAGLASILNATTPIFGVVVLIGVDALQSVGDHLLAELAILGATFCYGLAAVWSRRFRGRPPIATATGQIVSSAVVLTPIALVVSPPWAVPMPSLGVIAAVVALAVLSTALAFVLFFDLTTRVGPTDTTLVTFLIPPSAILLSTVFLGERLAIQHLAGMALIGLGLVAVDGRLYERLRTPR
ncbi:MAG: DMT family transporter [Phyllobacteriaceae bacterium]|nr:DMT family transporter [Phyllobacteriaceae bacterium]